MTTKKDKKFLRNTILLGFGAFLIATLILFSLSSQDASERFKDRTDELKDELFDLKVNLSLQKQQIEKLRVIVENEGISRITGSRFIDYTENGGEGGVFVLDSDQDGLVDEIDPNPERPRTTIQTFDWEYEGNAHSMQLQLSQDWYDYYVDRRRATTKEHFLTPSDPMVLEITQQLFGQMQEKGYVSTTEFVLSFVQNIEFKEDNETKGYSYPRYPMETLWDNVGDCEDMTYLAASILVNLNVDIVLLDIPGHIVVGAACSNCEGVSWKHNGKDYYYIESTATGWRLGEIPDEYTRYIGQSIVVRDV